MPFTLCIFFGLISVVFAQNCKPTGYWCADTPQCCGGCCIQNVCVQTYEDCRELHHNLCLEFYCPPDSECFLYRPPNCKGCDIQRECRYLTEHSHTNKLLHSNFTRQTEHHSASKKTIAFIPFVLTCVLCVNILNI